MLHACYCLRILNPNSPRPSSGSLIISYGYEAPKPMNLFACIHNVFLARDNIGVTKMFVMYPVILLHWRFGAARFNT